MTAKIQDGCNPLISVIIPVWGDDALIEPLVCGISPAMDGIEWIVAAVDPGSQLKRLDSDGLIRLVPCKEPSRGSQMNRGANTARGRIFCFHHADTVLTSAHLLALRGVVAESDVVGGAFHRRFDNRHPWMQRWEKLIHAFDCGYGPFFGDQSLYVRSEVFGSLGGFADIPLMEDLEFSGRLKREGRVRLLHPPIWSSARRFRRIGNLRATVFNAGLIGMFYAGVSTRTLHRWYYAEKRRDQLS